jgi:lipopolysaccharide/colanic/teichoic acid biosynthesis glycosyltransferase
MKRIFDIVLVFLLLFFLFPVYLLVALGVIIDLGLPVIFKQSRPGLNGKIFRIFKFRTMVNVTDDKGNPFPDKDRLTKFGNFLRSTSIDELPSLLNVLKGDMSLVGPRPLLVKYLSLYTKRQAKRHIVKPGITGWSQVNGRNSLNWEAKFELDIWYVENQSFWLDFKILFLTVKKIIIQEGITPKNDATMPEFKGSKK